jgi:hypothetical protein
MLQYSIQQFHHLHNQHRFSNYAHKYVEQVYFYFIYVNIVLLIQFLLRLLQCIDLHLL